MIACHSLEIWCRRSTRMEEDEVTYQIIQAESYWDCLDSLRRDDAYKGHLVTRCRSCGANRSVTPN